MAVSLGSFRSTRQASAVVEGLADFPGPPEVPTLSVSGGDREDPKEKKKDPKEFGSIAEVDEPDVALFVSHLVRFFVRLHWSRTIS